MRQDFPTPYCFLDRIISSRAKLFTGLSHLKLIRRPDFSFLSLSPLFCHPSNRLNSIYYIEYTLLLFEPPLGSRQLAKDSNQHRMEADHPLKKLKLAMKVKMTTKLIFVSRQIDVSSSGLVSSLRAIIAYQLRC